MNGPGDKTCPRCAETVKPAAQVCRFCGFDFRLDSMPAPPRQRQAPTMGVWIVLWAVVITVALVAIFGRGREAPPASTAAPAVAEPTPRMPSPAERAKALRDYDEFTQRGCADLPATTERLVGRRMTPAERRRSIAECLREARAGRAEIEKAPVLILP